MGLKEEKRPNTLMEYMGFKDPDLELKSHDDIVSLVSQEKNIIKLIQVIAPLELPKIEASQIYQYYHPLKIEVEKSLSDNYKKYGFLDVGFRFSFNCVNSSDQDKKKIWISDGSIFGFVEVKTKEQSFGSLLREMEYYKDTIKKLRMADYILPICITPTKIPNHIKQCYSFTFEEFVGLSK